MSATPPYIGGSVDRGAPCYGEDNEYVLGELLGFDTKAIAEARRRRGHLARGVTTTSAKCYDAFVNGGCAVTDPRTAPRRWSDQNSVTTSCCRIPR